MLEILREYPTVLERYMKILIFIFITVALASCSSDRNNYSKSESVVNHVLKNIPTPWKQINGEGSDFALTNNATKSIFLFNSSCRKYEGSNLNSLTSSLLTGIDELNVIERKNIFVQERDASELSASGKIDGVQRFLKIITIQKNSCIYDFVLISTNAKTLDSDSNYLKQFLTGIVIN
jgi:hypothetical protein